MFRKLINGSPAVVAVVVGVAVLCAGWMTWSQFAGTKHAASTSAYFSTDDGKTWFADDINKVPPFEKNGQQAYRVHVVQCGQNEPYVLYMERYTPRAKEIVQRANADVASRKKGDPPTPALMEMLKLGGGGKEIKRPGDKDWVAFDPRNRPNAECKAGESPVDVEP